MAPKTVPLKMIIGTRASPLARAQADLTRNSLAQALGQSIDTIDILALTTTGDQITDRPLSDSGGKGLFTKEIDAAQLSGKIDIAVHSAKDLPTKLPDGLMIAGYLPREDARDAFIGGKTKRLMSLPQGARIGTASLRRQAQLKRLRPDVEIVLLRGNVGTRLAKMQRGDVDGTLLAVAGLNRLDLTSHATHILDIADFLPAVGQGAICLIINAENHAARDAVATIACFQTALAITCERAFLTVLDGSCRTPIAGHARFHQDQMIFCGEVLTPDGQDFADVMSLGSISTLGEAEELGTAAGHDLVQRAPKRALGIK